MPPEMGQGVEYARRALFMHTAEKSARVLTCVFLLCQSESDQLAACLAVEQPAGPTRRGSQS